MPRSRRQAQPAGRDHAPRSLRHYPRRAEPTSPQRGLTGRAETPSLAREPAAPQMRQATRLLGTGRRADHATDPPASRRLPLRLARPPSPNSDAASRKTGRANVRIDTVPGAAVPQATVEPPLTALWSGRAGGFTGATAPRPTLARDLGTRLAPPGGGVLTGEPPTTGKTPCYRHDVTT